jgi:hypothetical protein
MVIPFTEKRAWAKCFFRALRTVRRANQRQFAQTQASGDGADGPPGPRWCIGKKSSFHSID